jgi:NADPH2:quinone reductase
MTAALRTHDKVSRAVNGDTASGVAARHHGEILREATRMSEAGATRIDPRPFTLDHALEAHDALSSGAATGRLVVDLQ